MSESDQNPSEKISAIKFIMDIIKSGIIFSFKSPKNGFKMFKFLLKDGFAIFKIIFHQFTANRRRKKWAKKGVKVPIFMIFSVTETCNLGCKGCYSHELKDKRNCKEELSLERIDQLIGEARDLGISYILIAGGEPLMRPELLDITMKYPQIVFPIFTNGLLIDEEIIKKLKKQKNTLPIISLEGFKHETDLRRGDGVYNRLIEARNLLKENRINYGVSLTITSENFDVITGKDFVTDLSDVGAKLFFYIEYIPVENETEDLVLSDEQEEQLTNVIDKFKTKFLGTFLAFPGDEKKFGGCLSSGKGFVHISPSGDLEPCPFAPYSDSNVREMSLKDALQSKFLRVIRENHDALNQSNTGCALWENRTLVQQLLNQSK